MDEKKRAILVILDGFGERKSNNYNAVKLAHTPHFDKYWKKNSHAFLEASSTYVGLPKGVIGNSEVGHTHIGAGRILEQELTKLNKEIKSKKFFSNKKLNSALTHVKKNKSNLHLLGLLSDGGVHSHINHLFALLKLAKLNKIKNTIYIHVMLDGRDVPPKSALKYIELLNKEINKLKVNAKIVTAMGRYYGMDRDKRWHREHKAYSALVKGSKCRAETNIELIQEIKKQYHKGTTDEFILPITSSEGRVCQGDSIIFFNFRGDRAREITRAFVDKKFRGFKRKIIKDLKFVCLTQYDKKIKADVAYPPHVPKNTLGEVFSKLNMKQFRIAETEKYAHVTFFFNGGRESAFVGEKRFVIPSKKVRTYDTVPEMRAKEISKNACSAIKTKKYKFVLINFSNPDMIGHTGKISAAVKAIEETDKALGAVVERGLAAGYDIIVTADHGNAEEMNGVHKTSHTTNKVPFVLIGTDEKSNNKKTKNKIKKFKNQSIANVAPTILKLMGVKKPVEMGRSLI